MTRREGSTAATERVKRLWASLMPGCVAGKRDLPLARPGLPGVRFVLATGTDR
jgi:hypothetical protein